MDERNIPVLATIPRSGTWFLRYAISFLAHLQRGGRITDQLTGTVFGRRWGAEFNFRDFEGGPLFEQAGLRGVDYMFIGHCVCPGFRSSEPVTTPWNSLGFHVRGYDYFGEGWDYANIGVEPIGSRGRRHHVFVDHREMEVGALLGRFRAALVYREPIEQAASYKWYSAQHRDPAFRYFRGEPVAGMSFEKYLLECALPSYAKQFLSFQRMAQDFPAAVRLIRYADLMADSRKVVAGLLDHLLGEGHRRDFLEDAIHLARRDHLRAIEEGMGKSLDGTGALQRGHIRGARDDARSGDRALRRQAMDFLSELGVDTSLFEDSTASSPPSDTAPASARDARSVSSILS
ncbi:hypothetical protein [Reyranella sp.]|uniref:hypothetical protein n=1 Tax=Reyranella sp. TaxID=1929291 RepID=UPI003BA84A31